MGLAKIAFAARALSAVAITAAIPVAVAFASRLAFAPRLTFGRGGFLARGDFFGHPGGDVFGAFDFFFVALALKEFVWFFVADGLGAGFLGVAIWLFAVADTARRAEAHAAATAAGKISVTHNLIRPPIDMDAVKNADGDQRANDRGAAITEKGQRNARHRHQAYIHANVDEDVAEQESHHAGRQ